MYIMHFWEAAMFLLAVRDDLTNPGCRNAVRTARCRRHHKRAARVAVEPLEPRLLLSLTVLGRLATYDDVDGDLVTIAVSVGALSPSNFTFDAGGTQLQTLNLINGTTSFNGANISITVKRGDNGDGLANIGFLSANGINLGTVAINGDLGRIEAGANSATILAIRSLTVRSIGRMGLDTQDGAGSLRSYINGSVGSITVKGDVRGAAITLNNTSYGNLNTLTIGGSLIGTDASFGGRISVGTRLGTLKIAGDIHGGEGYQAGLVTADTIGSATVGGSLFGASGSVTGAILSTQGISTVNIGGSLIGGAGDQSGRIDCWGGAINKLTVKGSVIGGAGERSGSIHAATGLGTIKIGMNLRGGAGDDSGEVFSDTTLTSITIAGSLIGDVGDQSGSIYAGSALASGTALGNVKIGMDVRGGAGMYSGRIYSNSKLAGVTVNGSLIGSTGFESGVIHAQGDMTKATLGGSIFGGTGVHSGCVSAGNTNALKIGGDVQGGMGAASGAVEVQSVLNVAVGGSVLGGAANDSGSLFSSGNMGKVTLGGSLVGSSISTRTSLDQTGMIGADGAIASVTIGGSVISGSNLGRGTLTASGTIRSGHTIGALAVKGSLIGNQNATNSSPVIVSAVGPVNAGHTSNIAIGRVTIGGRVECANILAGYFQNLDPHNADAQIGPVTVGGDWIMSNLVAGASNSGDDGNFGDANDQVIAGAGVNDNSSIHSLITSVTIKGAIFGGPLTGDGPSSFGFVAESIGVFKYGGITLPAHLTPILSPLQPNDNVNIHVLS
jgi:hypothetical protein